MSIKVPIYNLVSHTRKVQSLYKRALRLLECYHTQKPMYRYHCAKMRHRFEENRNITDLNISNALMVKGEHELWKRQHWNRKQFCESSGGCAYERVVEPPDWLLDYWHPLEKAQYPDYFKRREQRKQEYLNAWARKYGYANYQGCND